MIRLSRDSLSSPLAMFFIYILASAAAIMAFRFIYPGEAAPLGYFSMSWRFIRFLLDYLNLFPALALSALVIPFGLKIRTQEKLNPFSPQFLRSLKMSILTAITGAALYCALFFLVLPLVQDYEAKLRYQGQLYNLAKERAQEHAAGGEWNEAAHFISVCENIWPKGPEISKLKTETGIQAEKDRLTPWLSSDVRTGALSAQGIPQPVDATEALALAETALAEERYFDAHWLATLGGHLARPGSVEESSAIRLAGRAWSGVNSLEPNIRESRAYTIFRLKRDGYEALISEEWIRAYYIFRELMELGNGDDPDVQRYFALSENGLKDIAFFIDEMELNSGRTISGAIFSIPQGSGRLVMKVSSLSTSADSAYGIGIEILAFNREGQPLWGINAPYAKLFPLTLESGPVTAVLMRALDRTDGTKRWEGEARGMGQKAPDGIQAILQVSWDDFLLITKVRRQLSGRFPLGAMSPAELLKAAEDLEPCGYQPQVFQAELIERFGGAMLILPLGIFAIILGWRYRAMKRPRYMFIPMLGILPLVFNGVVQFCRSWMNNLAIWAVVSLGFTAAALIFAAGIFILFVLSLILLAAQHG